MEVIKSEKHQLQSCRASSVVGIPFAREGLRIIVSVGNP